MAIDHDMWYDCYESGWKKVIVDEAFSHPAKFSRCLIERIYDHAFEMGWVKPGDYVLDPFGGVGLGALDAISMGLNWVGCELEQKFTELAQKNFIKWNNDLRGWPNLGTARMVNGDSRNLKAVIEGADIVVSSPPFLATEGGCKPIKGPTVDNGLMDRHGATGNERYGSSPGQLGSMKEGNFDAIVSSPPYSEIRQDGGSSRDGYKGLTNYSGEPGNYWRTQRDQNNLGNMPEGNFDICVSSPPYEDIRQDGGRIAKEGMGGFGAYTDEPPEYWHTQRDQANLGNLKTGDTFWTASREIVSQCYDLLKPGGHAIWVCKDYVKNKKRVPFTDKWTSLCESVGFTVTCHHHATLVVYDMFGNIIKERKSFFRRLAESKGSPRIDWEDVTCFEK